MYATIESKNFLNNGRSKSMWVNSSIENIELVNKSAPHLYPSPWHINLRGETLDLICSGERGGDPVEIERKLLLQLTPEDLAMILNFAIDHDLISLSVKS